MNERKKKTGDVITWFVVDKHAETIGPFGSRKEAREMAADFNKSYRLDSPHRIAKVVLAK